LRYIEMMEVKIKTEVISREQLAMTYERSLTLGAEKLNNETEALAENPLVKEISLIVASELLKKGTMNVSIEELLR
jgi:hypothetical protein